MRTAKMTAQPGSDAYRRTFVDANRLIKITDRRFHCTWEEMRNAKVWISERVAGELLSFGHPRNLKDARAEAIRICENEQSAPLVRGDAARDLWWMSEWEREDGIVGLARTEPDRETLREKLLSEMPPALFHMNKDDNLEEHPDARIVAEVVAARAELLLSSNFRTVEVTAVNDWLKAQGYTAQGGKEGPIHVVDEYVHECMEANEAGRVIGMQSVLSAFWPEDREADTEDVIDAAVAATDIMRKEGAHLNMTGAYLADRLGDRRWRPWIERTIKDLRERGPERVRLAERRHPKHKAWRKRDWGDNTPELAQRLSDLRIRWPRGQIIYRVSERSGKFGIGWKTAEDGEILEVGTANGANEVAEVLSICGIESEVGKKETAGGLLQGRASYLARERGREPGR